MTRKQNEHKCTNNTNWPELMLWTQLQHPWLYVQHTMSQWKALTEGGKDSVCSELSTMLANITVGLCSPGSPVSCLTATSTKGRQWKSLWYCLGKWREVMKAYPMRSKKKNNRNIYERGNLTTIDKFKGYPEWIIMNSWMNYNELLKSTMHYYSLIT